jgi:hypothetical protein
LVFYWSFYRCFDRRNYFYKITIGHLRPQGSFSIYFYSVFSLFYFGFVYAQLFEIVLLFFNNELYY